MPNMEAMDFYNGRYFVINMNMLRFTGLWPYQNKTAKFCIRAVFSSLILIPGIPQLISAYVHKDNTELLIQGIGTFLYFISMGCKYFSMLITEEKLKYLYKNMVENWNFLVNETEIEILKESGEMGRLLTMGYLGYMIMAVQAFVSLPLLPQAAEMFLPSFSFLNDTKGRMFVLDGEYLLDRDKYYNYIYAFETLTCVMTVAMFSTIDSTYAVCVEQCVGLLKVVKLRLEISTQQSMKFDEVSHRNIDVARDAIIKSAILHEKVLNFGSILESSYSTTFLFVMFTSTCSLVTITMSILYNLHHPVFLLRFFILLAGFAMHVFFFSWPGQKIIDHSNAVFHAAYNNEWYECSIQSQQLLKFIMGRTLKPLQLTSRGVYVMNIENSEKIMKTALSYITVFRSFT